jgi:VWFA-related protein
MSRTALPAAVVAVILPLFSADVISTRISADSSLVLVPVGVSTSIGTPVTDLDRQNFQLYEDNVEQTITHFSLEDAPISVGVVFDMSGSMHNKMHDSAGAVSAFLHATNPADEFFLVEFSERARLTVPFTPDGNEIFR